MNIPSAPTTHGRAGRLAEHWNSPRRWVIIRAFYAEVTPAILRGERIDPYALGVIEHLTPIERAIWEEIRRHGLPFYPQYPIGRRFVDFGDPVRRIAIEVDGAAYHTPERDAEKDADLLAEDWSVARIPGAAALRDAHALDGILMAYGRTPAHENAGGE